MVTLKEGQRLGRYRVESLLDTGGFAKIYRGFDTERRRRVAIKVPATRYPRQEQIDDFRREVAENRKLRHPLILPIIDFFEVGAIPVIVMPLGRGSLADRLETRLPRARVLRYAHDLLRALAHAHRQHVLHLDIKPENLIVLRSGRLALADFGAARRGHRTVHGQRIGTAAYMAPEQAAGSPSARSDVFAAGLVIGEMLWGRPGGAERWRRRLPEGLAALVERATDPDPKKRHADAGAMLADLRRIDRRLDRGGQRGS